MIQCQCGMEGFNCNVQGITIENSRNPVIHVYLNRHTTGHSEVLAHLDANGLVELIRQAKAALLAMAETAE